MKQNSKKVQYAKPFIGKTKALPSQQWSSHQLVCLSSSLELYLKRNNEGKCKNSRWKSIICINIKSLFSDMQWNKYKQNEMKILVSVLENNADSYKPKLTSWH